MANKGHENLKPQNTRTKAEQREIARKGGIESGKSKRKKKLMSQIYAEILAEKAGTGKGLDLKGVVRAILKDGGSPAVSMLKEVREATEGNKLDLSGDLKPVTIIVNGVSASKDNE